MKIIYFSLATSYYYSASTTICTLLLLAAATRRSTTVATVQYTIRPATANYTIVGLLVISLAADVVELPY